MWRRAPLLSFALLVTACAADVVTSTSPPSATSAAVDPRPLPVAGNLSVGSYSLGGFPVAVAFDIPAFEPPAEWFSCSESAVEQSACHSSTPNTIVAVAFQIVDNVVADPCAGRETPELLDPPVGPGVDDLVTAISSLQGYQATAPVDITVSGFDGIEFTLTAPDRDGCGSTWATADRTTGMGPGEINLLRILDVDGVRVMISGAYRAETPEAELNALQQVIDSVQIEPHARP